MLIERTDSWRMWFFDDALFANATDAEIVAVATRNQSVCGAPKCYRSTLGFSGNRTGRIVEVTVW